MKKIKLISITMVAMICIIFSKQYILAASSDFGGSFDYNLIPKDEQRPSKLDRPIIKAWNTVALIIQIAAFAGIIITGLRYMFSSANGKADLKKGLIPLVIGLVLVFGATTIIQLVVNSYEEVAPDK